MPTLAVLGAGPGLGFAVARRFQREGYATALVSRRGSTIEGARAYPADLTDPSAVTDVLAEIRADLGEIDVLYFGPTVLRSITALTEVTPADLRAPIEALLMPAVTAIGAVLPAMVERGSGAILLPGGLSGLRPMPMLGSLAPVSAALRMYALTLHEQLAPSGIFVGALTIGGLVAGGDIHKMVSAGNPDMTVLDPDDLAAAAWRMVTDRGPAEEVFVSPEVSADLDPK